MLGWRTYFTVVNHPSSFCVFLKIDFDEEAAFFDPKQ